MVRAAPSGWWVCRAGYSRVRRSGVSLWQHLRHAGQGKLPVWRERHAVGVRPPGHCRGRGGRVHSAPPPPQDGPGQGFPLIWKRIFPNVSKYFRIRAGPANSKYSECIRIFPNMRRVSIRVLEGYGEDLLCCGGCTLGMLHTPSPRFFSSVNTSMPVPTPDEFPSEQATNSTIG